MFNTTILDVAIGLIFIYLLLSLMCTAANEIIELLLKKRAIDLERGIRELLVPGTASGKPDIVQELYNHPLINGLFGSTYEESGIATRRRWLVRTYLPSYIPARNFSLALMDLIRPGVGATGAVVGASGASEALAPSPSQPPPSPAQVVVNVTGGGTPLVAPTAPPVPSPSLVALRAALLAHPQITDQIKKGLIPLVDAAGNDVVRVRENIETWFNASMDRVSSWYKRRAQVTILILGLFIAVTVNVDTITIAKRLSTDKALRESLVAASDAYAKANATASPSPSPSPATPTTPEGSAASGAANATGRRRVSDTGQGTSGASPSPSPATALSPSPSVAPSATPTASAAVESTSPSPLTPTIPECVKDATSAECQGAKDLVAACENRESPKCKYLDNLMQIQALGLPIGWDATDDPKRTWPGLNFFQAGGWLDQIYWHALGWILTALALSLGAPFWFDLLNKFIVIRSAVKPHEKSPEEGSKD